MKTQLSKRKYLISEKNVSTTKTSEQVIADSSRMSLLIEFGSRPCTTWDIFKLSFVPPTLDSTTWDWRTPSPASGNDLGPETWETTWTSH